MTGPKLLNESPAGLARSLSSRLETMCVPAQNRNMDPCHAQASSELMRSLHQVSLRLPLLLTSISRSRLSLQKLKGLSLSAQPSLYRKIIKVT